MADEEQHADAFNMDADYEGLVEAGGEFFYASRKTKRQQSREEALYGYQSSDSDEDGGGGGRRGGKRSKKADYSKPVGFVSSGVIQQQPDDEAPKQPAAATQPPRKSQQQDAANGSSGTGLGFGGAGGLGFGSGSSSSSSRGGIGSGSSTAGLGSGAGSGGGGGLGFVAGGSSASASGGLGFKSAGTTQQQQQQQQGLGASGMLRHQEQQQADDDEAGVLPTAFGRKIKAAAEAKQQQRAAQAAAVTQRSAARAANPDIGAFEAHTKGIGLKLLAKMGFTPGQGLGRNKQGIAKPLEAKLRPKGAGMGYGGFQEAKMVLDTPASQAEAAAAKAAAAAAAGGDPDAAELEGELAAATAKLQAPLWKKKAAPARQRRTYRTAEDVLEESAGGGDGGSSRPGGLISQPILDLRGPQARLVTDLEQLNAVQDEGAGGDAGPPMPELHHNLGLLVSLTEAQLRRLDAALQHQQDTAALLTQEKQRLAKEAAAAAAASDRLAGLTARLAHVRQLDGALSLGQLREEYGGMAAAYPEEYTLFSLAAAALAQVLPRMRRLLSGWQPLSQPQLGAAEATAWRPLLESDAARGAVLRGPGGWADSGDPFATLVAEVVLPPVRSAITQWEPRQPEPLLAWFDTWAPLLPRGATQQLLTGLVLPRIAAAVEGWDPTRETQPIHAWLHPWLPYLAAELVGVYPTIRHRLSRALTAWHASDGSARILLAPWSKVFEPQDWESLMARAIVPKLAQALQTELVLHPLEPQLEPLEWALSWAGLLPLNQLAGLLEAAFFPAWLAILHHWLSAAPDFDEVTRWYLEWKGRLPQELLDHPRVRAAFATALNMMNAAADGHPLPPPSSLPSAGTGAGAGSVPAWRREVEADAAAGPAGYGKQPPATSAAVASGPEPSLRELVGRYASEAGCEFLPRAGRLHDGLPVYAFGGVSCVVDGARGVIRAQLKDRGWVPVSLERLKAEAQAKAGGG